MEDLCVCLWYGGGSVCLSVVWWRISVSVCGMVEDLCVCLWYDVGYVCLSVV
jgi:hypothetical protein